MLALTWYNGLTNEYQKCKKSKKRVFFGPRHILCFGSSPPQDREVGFVGGGKPKKGGTYFIMKDNSMYILY